MNKNKIITRALILFGALFTIFIVFQILGVDIENISDEHIKELAHDNIYLLLIILFGIMFLQNLLNFFPIVLVISLNVSLLGLWGGYLFSLFCSVVASTIIFLVIRYMFIDMKAAPKYEKYTKKIEKNGFLYVLIARLIPIMPTNVINIASGLSSIKLRHYTLATILGHAIYSFIIAAASFNIFS
jgi:uncharacterized membrane protein YdjX (TVP38/TMEM64 family)